MFLKFAPLAPQRLRGSRKRSSGGAAANAQRMADARPRGGGKPTQPRSEDTNPTAEKTAKNNKKQQQARADGA